MPNRLNLIQTNKLKIGVLSVATAMGTLGLSQVACADLTWGDASGYQ